VEAERFEELRKEICARSSAEALLEALLEAPKLY